MYALNDFATLDSDLALSLDDLDLVLGGDAPEPGAHEDQPTNGAPPGFNANSVSANADIQVTAEGTQTLEILADTVRGAVETVEHVVDAGRQIIYDYAHPIAEAIGQETGQIIHAIGDRVEGFIRGDGGTSE